MTTSIESVLYSRLEVGQIRLISAVQQGAFSEPLRCELRVVSLEDKPQYKALSYVWGDPNITTKTQLYRLLHQATVNLESALRHLRSDHHDVSLWVDTVCINQKDLVERGSQVAQMGRIYASAEQVVAWLVNATKKSDLAIDGIQLFTSNPNLHWTTPSKISAAFRRGKYLLALLDITTRPWWKRV